MHSPSNAVRSNDECKGGACYDLFISHSTRIDPDMQELVDALADALSRRGLRVFLDRRVFDGSEALLASLEAALERSKLVLIVLTYLAEISAWVEFEVVEMSRRRAAGQMRILALQINSSSRLPAGIDPDVIISPSTIDDLSILCSEVERAVKTALAGF